jgi:N-acetylglucosaminyldiphosphoundecaprenol N-acetyl-beta-D-mannosaminyltransferase
MRREVGRNRLSRQRSYFADVVHRLFVGDLDEGTEAVVVRARSGEGGYACLVNAHVLATARRDADLQMALDEAWTVFPDGYPVAWLLRRLGNRRAARIAGPDLMPAVIERGQREGLRHFLFGSTESVLRDLEVRLRAICPEAIIVGSFSPERKDFAAEIDPRSIDVIRAASPDVVWCALGAPKQETWMVRNADALRPAVVLGVGAAFDFVAGKTKRAPQWMQRFGLEWIHRLLMEPRRLTKRYLSTNTVFVLSAARLILGTGRSRIVPLDRLDAG